MHTVRFRDPMTSFHSVRLIILPCRRRGHPVRHSGHALLLRTKASVQVRQSLGESVQIFLPRHDMAHHCFRVGCLVRGPGHTVSRPGLLSGERLFFAESSLQLIHCLLALPKTSLKETVNKQACAVHLGLTRKKLSQKRATVR